MSLSSGGKCDVQLISVKQSARQIKLHRYIKTTKLLIHFTTFSLWNTESYAPVSGKQVCIISNMKENWLLMTLNLDMDFLFHVHNDTQYLHVMSSHSYFKYITLFSNCPEFPEKQIIINVILTMCICTDNIPS